MDQHIDNVPVMEARKVLVRRYRENPRPWPDGIDSPRHRWYVPEEWTDDGTYIGPGAAVHKAPGAVHTAPIVDTAAVHTSEAVDNAREAVDSEVDRKAYKREWMRRQRAAKAEGREPP